MKRPYGYLVMGLQTQAKIRTFGEWEAQVDLTSIDQGCIGVLCMYRLKKDAERAARRGHGIKPHMVIPVDEGEE